MGSITGFDAIAFREQYGMPQPPSDDDVIWHKGYNILCRGNGAHSTIMASDCGNDIGIYVWYGRVCNMPSYTTIDQGFFEELMGETNE